MGSNRSQYSRCRGSRKHRNLTAAFVVREWARFQRGRQLFSDPLLCPPLCSHRLSAQICELKQQLAEATATAKSATTMSPQASPSPPPGGAVGIPGGDAGLSSLGVCAPIQAAGGQGYIYVVDPALQVEIERLRETVADRERVIEDMEMGERHNLHAVSAGEVEGLTALGPEGGKSAKCTSFIFSQWGC